jgi:hypothetical protein
LLAVRGAARAAVLDFPGIETSLPSAESFAVAAAAFFAMALGSNLPPAKPF